MTITFRLREAINEYETMIKIPHVTQKVKAEVDAEDAIVSLIDVTNKTYLLVNLEFRKKSENYKKV